MKKRLFRIIKPVIFLSLLLVSCDTTIEDMINGYDIVYYSIGDTGPGGGIVFYITDGGLHGLEAAPGGWSGVGPTTSIWSTVSTLLGTTGIAIGTGSTNTDAIINQNKPAASAALACRNYNGGGKNDWFLPSRLELIEMRTQKDVIGISSGSYWSSSESGASYAEALNFGNIFPQYDEPKSGSTYIRPIRAF